MQSMQCLVTVIAAALTVLIAPAARVQIAAQPSSPKEFSSDSKRFVKQGGENIYRASCQGCHMAEGQGAKGTGFCPVMSKNPRLASTVYSTPVVLNGLRGTPAFTERLSDQQVADVVNYVRSSFGNTYADKVSPADAKKARP